MLEMINSLQSFNNFPICRFEIQATSSIKPYLLISPPPPLDENQRHWWRLHWTSVWKTWLVKHNVKRFPCGTHAAKKNNLVPKKTVPFRPRNFSEQTLKMSIYWLNQKQHKKYLTYRVFFVSRTKNTWLRGNWNLRGFIDLQNIGASD